MLTLKSVLTLLVSLNVILVMIGNSHARGDSEVLLSSAPDHARSKRDLSDECSITTSDMADINTTLAAILSESDTQLIEYTITMENSSWPQPSPEDSQPIYRPDRWTRIVSIRGRALLALVFNYEVVSGYMLSFGVHKMKVTIHQENCNYTELVDALRWLVYDDFGVESESGISEYKEVCNQIIEDGARYSDIEQECYKTSEENRDEFTEPEKINNRWINVLHRLLDVVRIFIILYGPLLFQSWLYEGDLQSSVPYVIYKERRRELDIEMKSVTEDPDHKTTDEANLPLLKACANSHVPMERIRSHILENHRKNIVHFSMKTKTVNVIVDHTRLMSQSAVPVSVFSFIRSQIFNCEILERDWIKSCAKAGCLFGLWPTKGNRFQSLNSNFPPPKPTWGRIFKLISVGFVACVLVPLPFHIRVLTFARTEADEMSDRVEAARAMGFSDPYFGTFWFGISWPGVVTLMYLAYGISLVAVAVIHKWVIHKMDDILQDCIYDLQSISYSSILSMFFYYLLLPFKDFGFLFGLILAIPYYVVFIPLALVIALFYGIPILYMSGRLFYNFRPNFLESKMGCPCKSGTADNNNAEQEGDWTFSSLFELERISPDTRLYPRLPLNRLQERWHGKCHLCNGRSGRYFSSVLISLTMFVLMLTVVFMYAEGIRFFLHVVLLALSGLVLNSKHTMDYFILCFWTLMYTFQTLKSIHTKYNIMSQNLFKFFKDHLSQEISDATRVPEDVQMFTGFKYFKKSRLKDIKQKMKRYVVRDEREDFEFDTNDHIQTNADGTGLEWDIHGLVLFIDNEDRPRMPKELFWLICDNLKAPGCPGPLQHSIAEALKQLASMLLFLFIIFTIIMSFHDSFLPGSNNQLLLTMASGFLPLIIRTVLPGSPKVDLSEYSLKGKIEEILLEYREKWPAYDVIADCEAKKSSGVHEATVETPDAESPAEEKKTADRYREDDLETMDLDGDSPEVAIVAESAPIVAQSAPSLGGLPPSTSRAPLVKFTQPTAVDTTPSDIETGSIQMENYYAGPSVRIPKYVPKERVLTFALYSGPKEDPRHVIEPVLRDLEIESESEEEDQK